LTPGYYARSDTRTPVRFALVAIAVNIAGNIALIPTIGYLGPPIATAVSAAINAALLFWTLRKRGQFKADARLLRRLPRLALAAAIMGGALALALPLIRPFMAGDMVQRGVTLAVLVATGGAVYIAASFLTGAFRLSDLKALRRRAPQPTSPEPEQ